MKKFIAAIAGAALLALPAVAFAGSATGNVTVNATVNPACSLSSATLNFPAYDPSAASADLGSSSVSITCTKTTAWTAAGPGATPLSGPGPSGTDTLNSVINVAAGSGSGTGNGSAQPINIAGSIAPGQYVTPGAYSGLAVITANF